jgi:hypothetical protein
MRFYYHDAATGECISSSPRECSSSLGFRSLAECLLACPGSKPALDACDLGSDCTVVDPGCCGHCDPVSAADLTVANWQRAQDAQGCPGGVACGACAEVSELERTHQYFYADCQENRCRLVDVRETTAVSCTADAQCRLRAGAGCCEHCQGSGFVAVHHTDYLAQLCMDDLGCDDCEARIPPELHAACDENQQRCVVVEGAAGNASGGAPN